MKFGIELIEVFFLGSGLIGELSGDIERIDNRAVVDETVKDKLVLDVNALAALGGYLNQCGSALEGKG